MTRRKGMGRGVRSYDARPVNVREPKQRFLERLLQQHNPPNPASDNPSTTVHKLVTALLQYAT